MCIGWIRKGRYSTYSTISQGTRVRGRPKNQWMDCVSSDIKKCKIRKWKEQSKDRGIWRRSIMEAKARIGL